MELYNRKPHSLEAIMLTAANAEVVTKWCGGDLSEERDRGVDVYAELKVPNVTGSHKAHIGDMIVKGSDGRFTVEKSEAFFTEYEKRSTTRSEVVQDAYGKGVPIISPLTPYYILRGRTTSY